MKLLLRTMVVLLVLCLALPLGMAQAMPPSPPSLFSGEVTIGGIAAPDDITVSAEIDNIEYASTTTSGGQYMLEVPTEDLAEPGKQGGETGDIVVFKVNAVVADSDPAGPITFEQGSPILELDLAVAGVLPVAEFSAIPLSGDEPLTIEFTDESLNMEEGPTWSWAFGDGGTSTEQNPTYQYLQEGSYTVSLMVTTAYGTDTEVKVDYIVVGDVDPVAGFTALPTSGDYPLEVSFTDTSSSYDGITWEWDFGDGGTSTEQSPTHEYLDEGTYTVALTVTEPDADSDMMVAENLIMVGVPPPVAAFSAIPLSGDEPLTIEFTDESLNMIHNSTWSWDFGDGGTSTEASPPHQFFYDGSYTVTLTVTTDDGTDTEVKADYIVVADTEPVASFTAEPTSGERPLEVFFTDSSDSHDGIISWEWFFGDGGISTEQNPSHTYEVEGTYTVALRVTEADADSDMMVAQALIAVTAPGDVTDPVIEHAWLGYFIGTESARPDDPFEVVAVVTDDTAVTLVELETTFGTFPLDGDVYEGIVIYSVVIEVPEDTPFGTYELTLRAEDAAANEATQSLELEVVPALTAYNIGLADGWNLISLPLIPDVAATGTILDGLSFLAEDFVRAVWGDEAADSMMPDINTVWHYDAVGEYGPAGQWLYFELATGVGDLSDIEDGKGYWVDVAIVDAEGPPSILTVYGVELVPGPELPPTYAVAEGWNLIGFKKTSPMPFGEYLSAVDGNYARVYGYDAYSQFFYQVGEEGGPDDMQPGAGYWIYMTDAGAIVP